MNLTEKKEIVANLIDKITEKKHFYVTDTADLNALEISSLRRKCFEKDIELLVVKNTLLKKALEQMEGDFEDVYGVLKGGTSIMFCETANVPAKLIKEFRKGSDKPVLKAAYVEESVYVGDNQVDALSNIKSKEELIGDIINLLQSPMKNVLGSLNSGKNILGGLVKTLSERAE